MDDLTSLINIGEKVAAELTKVGVSNSEELRQLGSVETVLRMTGRKQLVGYNILYAIEGAIRGIRWHLIPKEELNLLKEQYQRAVVTDVTG